MAIQSMKRLSKNCELHIFGRFVSGDFRDKIRNLIDESNKHQISFRPFAFCQKIAEYCKDKEKLVCTKQKAWELAIQKYNWDCESQTFLDTFHRAVRLNTIQLK